jgi:hypothetical protein
MELEIYLKFMILELHIYLFSSNTSMDRLNNYSKTVISVGSALNPILP